ncbi:hypothetical protein FRC08_018781 [Ceratobasidium sp. 394]|nr:hypothetical protein FRC08_018781 [Ceratobasidium sp. 394]
MASQIQSIIDGKIDFEGQKLVERTSQYVLVGAAVRTWSRIESEACPTDFRCAQVLSFGLGYATQSLQMCFGTFGISVLAVMLTFVPPWPFLNQHPPKWRKVKGKEQ